LACISSAKGLGGMHVGFCVRLLLLYLNACVPGHACCLPEERVQSALLRAEHALPFACCFSAATVQSRAFLVQQLHLHLCMPGSVRIGPNVEATASDQAGAMLACALFCLACSSVLLQTEPGGKTGYSKSACPCNNALSMCCKACTLM
jgi:hypothetical protein